jgi:hypothetical protein
MWLACSGVVLSPVQADAVAFGCAVGRRAVTPTLWTNPGPSIRRPTAFLSMQR